MSADEPPGPVFQGVGNRYKIRIATDAEKDSKLGPKYPSLLDLFGIQDVRRSLQSPMDPFLIIFDTFMTFCV